MRTRMKIATRQQPSAPARPTVLIPAVRGFGERLREAREARKLSQAMLAEAIGVTQATMSRYETNKDRPGGTQLQQLLTVLEINWAWLEWGRGEMMDAALAHFSGEVLEIARRIEALPAEQRLAVVKMFLNGLPPALATESPAQA